MRIQGQKLLLAVLDLVTEPGNAEDSQRDIAKISEHSALVLDSLNTDPETAVGGVVEIDVTVPAGADRFTWGPGGTVDQNVPAEIRAWNAIDTGGEPIPRTTRMLTTEEWANLQYDADNQADYPDHMYWTRTLDGAGRTTIRVWPKSPRPVRLQIWAVVPKILKIEPGRTYDIDGGRAQLLQTELARAVAPVFGFPISPEVADIARNAAARFRYAGQEPDEVVPAERFMIGSSSRRRGLYW